MPSPDASIYERIGGESAIMAAVSLFYEKVMADESLAPFFVGMDMGRQIDKQVAFMMMAFGGPHEYTGTDLTVAHAGLVQRGLNHDHFDRVTDCLKLALDELSVDPALVEESLAIVERTRGAIFGEEN